MCRPLTALAWLTQFALIVPFGSAQTSNPPPQQMSNQTARPGSPPQQKSLYTQPQTAQPQRTTPPPAAPAPDDDKSRMAQPAEPQQDTGGFWIWPEPAPFQARIATDRPGFSDSAALIPRGRTQLEFGYTFTMDEENGRDFEDHTVPETELRFGLTDWLEFQVLWAGYSWSERDDARDGPFSGLRYDRESNFEGGRDMAARFKLPILKEEGWIPNLSVIPSLGIPVGADSKSVGNVVPELKFPWNHSLGERAAIFGSFLGRVADGPNTGQFFQAAATLGAGYKVFDWMSLYVEYFGVYPAVDDEDCLHLLSGGPIFFLSDNLSVDTRVSVGLNEQAPDFQASIGFGIRF